MTDREAIRARTAYAVGQWTGDAAQCAADCAALLDELERAEAHAAMIETHLDDARTARDLFKQRSDAACKEVERLGPLAQEAYQLKGRLIFLREELSALQDRVRDYDRIKESLAALAGCARDNKWEGVSEGLHAYAWQVFLDSQTGRADQIRRWARRWKVAAKSERFRYQIAAMIFDQLSHRYDLLTRLARDAARVLRAATIRRGTRRWLADYERLDIREDEHGED